MIDALFEPKGVAVIGASAKELHIGNRIIKNLVDFGYTGDIYPINPNADEIRGLKAYKSVLDVPGQVDVAHMVIPARFTPQAFEDCGKKGVRHIIINSGGFSETGPEGEAIEKAFMDVARQYGMRVLGPNCQGIINSDPKIRAYCNFTFTFPEPGSISIVALSGGVAELIHQGFVAMGVGTRIYASNGNACDVSIPEIIRYLGEDEKTRVIVTYVEGLRNPSEFIAAVTHVAARKPVLAMKAGRTAAGAKAAASHTGGLAKEDLATDLIFKKAGVLNFMDEGELIAAAAAFATQPIPKGNRVGIITNTGGPAVIATDVFVGAGLELPSLSEKTEAFLKERLFPDASIRNPVDVLATAPAEHFRFCLDAMMADDNFDAVFVNFVTPFFVETDSIVREIVTVSQKQLKPIVCNLMTDRRQWTETVRILREGGVPFFAFPSEAARAMAALVRYQQIRQQDAGRVVIFDDVDKPRAEAILQKAAAAGRKRLSAAEVFEILAAYKIPVVDWGAADSVEAAVATAQQIGFPVAVKADSAAVVHKSDMGAVALDLKDPAAVRAAVEKMKQKIEADDLSFFVQKYVPGGLEIALGAKAEAGLGHLIMFGLGGIFVEVLKDVVFNLMPVTDAEADRMLSDIKGAALLAGVRGRRGVDREAVKELICRLSQLVGDLPVISEMDINPVLAFEDRAVVVDARISLD
ncbi:MAG: acetate--CoA ligase family protein [Desulfobacterales bacterium]|nr:acetate--CoA ligase family protein [Desulfobacterales bacterium]